MVTGVVLERDGGAYRVLTPQGEVRAILRGKVKRDQPKVVVGDRVRLDAESDGETFGIAAVDERTSLLERRVPAGRGARPVAANIDQVLVVTASRDPEPIPQLLDRLLVVAEANEISAAVILNKIDLDGGEALARRMERAGYTVIRTCAKTGAGLDELRAALAGKESVVTGDSGVGKSSLLNALEPGLGLRTGELSAKLKRGKQTTVSAIMVPLAVGGFLVDTPGFSEVGLWGLEPRELARCFPEFRPLLDSCRYADCSHIHEPGCAVRAAVERGEVAADRHASYATLLAELNSAPKEWE
ncbi:MAG: ribosome small subunit-dependent GTPase A [Gemmatimonadales bacterium]|nr:MAG: ribosome small subunit-dependent GTPase A [Gemmatimonadales bacterium]